MNTYSAVLYMYAHALFKNRAAQNKDTIACVGSWTSRVEAVVAKKTALLQIDAIAPVYASCMRFRHGRGPSVYLAGDVI